MQEYKGKSIYKGIAIGRIKKYTRKEQTVRRLHITDCESEIARFDRAREEAAEQLQALYDSKNIDITTLEEDVLDNASYYGRIFARSGGLSDAVSEAVKEQGLKAKLVLQIHDELLIEAPSEEVEAVKLILMDYMQNAVSLAVPMYIDIHTGKDMYAVK